jgi:hypothetical protein
MQILLRQRSGPDCPQGAPNLRTVQAMGQNQGYQIPTLYDLVSVLDVEWRRFRGSLDSCGRVSRIRGSSGHTVKWLVYLYRRWTTFQDTKRNTVVAKSFDLVQDIFPEINYRNSPGMELASVEEDTLAAYEQRMFVPSYL